MTLQFSFTLWRLTRIFSLAAAIAATSGLPVVAGETPQTHPRLERTNLLIYRNSKGEVAPVKSKADWQKRRAAVLAGRDAKHLKDTGIDVFAVIPGLVNTEGMRGLNNAFSILGRPFFRTPEQGARTPMWVATEPGLEAQSGKCFGNALGSGWRNETKLPSKASDPAIGEQVYALCEREAP